MKISFKGLVIGAIATLVSFAAQEVTEKGLWALDSKLTAKNDTDGNESNDETEIKEE